MKKLLKKFSFNKTGTEQKPEGKLTDNTNNNNISSSPTKEYSAYVLANTPLNMEDEERNPDCCW